MEKLGYIVLETFWTDSIFVEKDREGKTLIFSTKKEAGKYAKNLQRGLIVPLEGGITYTPSGEKGIEWWGKEKFKSRKMVIVGAGGKHIEITKMSVGDEMSVVCDICNIEITEFPVAVVNGYALCPGCFEKLKRVKSLRG